ncbi:MAG: DNA polymerase III subunit gamma/tau [Bacilli bacterium]|nr:DNA polymerase III subunit gamma/tau [Bacilli bacterium]
MAYKSIYRRYRPVNFDEVVGQKYIIQTIKNSIANDKLGHAYIFSGPRGIGKTTIARIVAKAVNCLNPQNGNPCNECAVCKAINDGSAIDIIEIDAASNNGVDEMRNLLEKVNFLPASFKKKIYIIDEVHMLSMSAFNALLKTLEEPPMHVMFILATTEPHKVPATILSRCQRYDFKPLSNIEIKSQLTKIKDIENISIDDDALEVIAEVAEGGMRDALSILDQVFAYGKENFSAEDVNNITGRVSTNDIIKLLNIINDSKVSDALDLVNDILNTGKEVSTLIHSMLVLCRDVILYQNIKNANNDKTIFNNQSFINLAHSIKKNKLFKFVDILNDIQNKIKHSNTPKIYLEVGIVKMVSNENNNINNQVVETVDLSDIYDRVQQLESLVMNLKDANINNDINEFKDFTRSKLEFLEEVVSRCAVPPKDLEERIEILEEQATNEELDRRLIVIENKVLNTDSTDSVVNNTNLPTDITERLYKLEGELQQVLMQEVSQNTQSFDSEEIAGRIQDISLQLEAYENIFVKQSDLASQLQDIKVPEVNLEDIYSRLNALESQTTSITPIAEIEEFNLEEQQTEHIEKVENEDFFNTYDDTYVDASEFEKMNDNYLTLLNKVIELQANISEEKEEIQKYISLFNELHEYVSNLPTNNIDEEVIAKLEEQIAEVKEYSIKVGSRCTALEEKYKNLKQDSEVIKPTIQRRPQPFETPLREEQQVREQTIVPAVETKVEEEVDVIEKLPEGQIDETAKAYDIRVIENILHQSRDRKNIEDKDKINSVWYRLSSLVPQNLASIAATLSEGKVVVNGANYFIIVYQKASICNYLMNAQNHYEAKEVLRLTLQKEYDFIALPMNTWHEKSTEYKGQYHMGIRYPKLTPINNPELKVINMTKNPFQTQSSQNLDKATQMFGKTLIREVK